MSPSSSTGAGHGVGTNSRAPPLPPRKSPSGGVRVPPPIPPRPDTSLAGGISTSGKAPPPARPPKPPRLSSSGGLGAVASKRVRVPPSPESLADQRQGQGPEPRQSRVLQAAAQLGSMSLEDNDRDKVKGKPVRVPRSSVQRGLATSPPLASTPPHASAPHPAPRTRTSTTPGVTLDASAYPHIMDAVIALTDRATKLALRGLSTALRDKVDADLYFHIIVDDPARAPGALSAPKVPWEVSMAEAASLDMRGLAGGLPGKPWHTLGADPADDRQCAAWISRLGRWTKAIDYHCNIDIAAVAPAVAPALAGLDYARRICPSEAVLPAGTVVDYLDISLHGYWSARPAKRHWSEAYIPPVPRSPAVAWNIINIVYSMRLGNHASHVAIGDRKDIHLAFRFHQREEAATCAGRSPEETLTVSLTAAAMCNDGPRPFGFIGALGPDLPRLVRDNRGTALVGATDVPHQLIVGVGDAMQPMWDTFPDNMVATALIMCPTWRIGAQAGPDLPALDDVAAQWQWLGGTLDGCVTIPHLPFRLFCYEAEAMVRNMGEEGAAFVSAPRARRDGGAAGRLWVPAVRGPQAAAIDARSAAQESMAPHMAASVECLLAFTALMVQVQQRRAARGAGAGLD